MALALNLAAALWASAAVRWSLVALLSLGAYKAWEHRQRSIGAKDVTAQITKKADDNAKKADDVRAAVDAGKRGRVHPYVRTSD